jgi:hypothetical protein
MVYNKDKFHNYYGKESLIKTLKGDTIKEELNKDKPHTNV